MGTYLKLELNNSVMDNVGRQIIMPVKKKEKLCGFSLQANYTDRA
jgi:hypothetical protein